jgi:hypothetical protein
MHRAKMSVRDIDFGEILTDSGACSAEGFSINGVGLWTVLPVLVEIFIVMC